MGYPKCLFLSEGGCLSARGRQQGPSTPTPRTRILSGGSSQPLYCVPGMSWSWRRSHLYPGRCPVRGCSQASLPFLTAVAYVHWDCPYRTSPHSLPHPQCQCLPRHLEWRWSYHCPPQRRRHCCHLCLRQVQLRKAGGRYQQPLLCRPFLGK